MPAIRLLSRRSLAAFVMACIVAGPLTVDFATAQEGEIESLREQREAQRREAAAVAAELDALAAEDEDLAAAIETLNSYIELQEALVSSAETSIVDAERLAEDARDEVAELDNEVAVVRSRLQIAAVNAFIDPDLDTLNQFDAKDLLDAEIKKSYVSEVLGGEVELIDELRRLQSASDAAVRRADDATAEAEAERIELAARLGDLAAARDEVDELRAQVSERVDEWQAVGAQIEAADDLIVDQIRELEAELARQAAAAAEAEAERVRLVEEEAKRLAEEAANSEDPEDPENTEEPEEPEAPVNLGPFSVTHRPVPGVITSSFGVRVHPVFGTTRNHYGIDLDSNRGEPISAAAAGTVLTAGWMNGYGNTIVISHGDGYTTLYAHQTSLAVSSGGNGRRRRSRRLHRQYGLVHRATSPLRDPC